MAKRRPEPRWLDRVVVDAIHAAAYAFGLVKNHSCRDGNKRVGSPSDQPPRDASGALERRLARQLSFRFLEIEMLDRFDNSLRRLQR